MAASQCSTSLLAPTTREYDGIIIFNFGSGLKYPFKYFPRKYFDVSEIRDEYYNFQLVPLSRMRKLKNLKKHKGSSLAIFAKVEKGTSDERKRSVVGDLNAEFHLHLETNKSIPSAYEAMVNKSPYKVLANFSYDWAEQPLGEDILDSAPHMTDVR